MQTPRERQVTPAGFTFNSQRAICSWDAAADARTASCKNDHNVQNGETLGNHLIQISSEEFIHTYIIIYIQMKIDVEEKYVQILMVN